MLMNLVKSDTYYNPLMKNAIEYYSRKKLLLKGNIKTCFAVSRPELFDFQSAKNRYTLCREKSV